MEERGLDYAVFVATKNFGIGKEALYAKFVKEFAEGRPILNARVDEGQGGWATLVIVGEDGEDG